MAISSVTIRDNKFIPYIPGYNKVLNSQLEYLEIDIEYSSSLNGSTYTAGSFKVDQIFGPIPNYIGGTKSSPTIVPWPYYVLSRYETSGIATAHYISYLARYEDDVYMIDFLGFNVTQNKSTYVRIERQTSTTLKFYCYDNQ